MFQHFAHRKSQIKKHWSNHMKNRTFEIICFVSRCCTYI